MKLRAQGLGTMTITVTDPATGRRWTIDPADDLRQRQLQQARRRSRTWCCSTCTTSATSCAPHGIRDPIITVDWQCSLNGAPLQPLVDPTVNLARRTSVVWPARWILRDGEREVTLRRLRRASAHRHRRFAAERGLRVPTSKP